MLAVATLESRCTGKDTRLSAEYARMNALRAAEQAEHARKSVQLAKIPTVHYHGGASAAGVLVCVCVCVCLG